MRTVPSPVYGVTLDDVSNIAPVVASLKSLVKFPTARVVFDTGRTAHSYLSPTQKINPVSYVMGLLIDSSYMKSYRSVAAVQAWTNQYVNALGGLVDIWEIGNEVNGDWLSRQSNGADVFPKIQAMFDIVSAAGLKTALTFFYEGEPGQPNCIAKGHGGNDMFSWINAHFIANPTPESEAMRLGLNYALISWYPDQCTQAKPNWATVYTKLAAIFPNAKVGFGELGTANPQHGSMYEQIEIATYYPMGKTNSGLASLPAYCGGYFWWYYAEEMVPFPGALGMQLNAALAAGP